MQLALLLASAVVIHSLRERLVERFRKVKQASDVLALPSPERTIVMSLGYRAALADWLFADVLVQSGIHVHERRRFEYLGEYLDTINALDPKFRSPYRFADTLLTLQSVPARDREYKKAREVLLRGLREFPHDQELWVSAGQFMAYLAAPNLSSPADQEAWRLEGARLMARGCELVSNNKALPYSCFGAAGMLHKAGQREATIRFLERFLAVNEDPELREQALRMLTQAQAAEQRERAERRNQLLRESWKRELPGVSRTQLILVGPAFDPAACAGPDRRSELCATSWRAFWELRADTEPVPTEG